MYTKRVYIVHDQTLVVPVSDVIGLGLMCSLCWTMGFEKLASQQLVNHRRGHMGLRGCDTPNCFFWKITKFINTKIAFSNTWRDFLLYCPTRLLGAEHGFGTSVYSLLTTKVYWPGLWLAAVSVTNFYDMSCTFMASEICAVVSGNKIFNISLCNG